jgi:2-polyprenyl-3-methyl-5-hydroxy-6-metoxy-1,4-benzoquinol methylase
MADTAQIKAYYESRYKTERLNAFPCDIARTSVFLRPIMERVAQGGNVLDVGCGVGYACELLLQQGFDVYGVDLAEEAIALARQRVPQGHFTPLVQDGPLPYPNAFFDAIACLGVLEHVVKPEGILNECRRVLKPAGLAVFVIPNTFSVYFLLSSGTGQIYEKPRTYTEWKRLLSNHQFTILEATKDPGPTMRKNDPITQKAKLLIHKFLNTLPLLCTYQFIFVVIPI